MPRAAWQSRITGGVLALLVQAGLIAAVFLSLTRSFFPPAPKETTLWLRPLPRATPRPVLRTIDARGPSRAAPAVLPDIKPPESLPAAPAGPSDLRAIGRALFGCAPEHYAELSPEDRAHCPKPGEGLAREPDLANPPQSHAKDEPYWQEQFRRARVIYGECQGDNPPIAVCLLRQHQAELQSEQEFDQQMADRKAATLRDSRPPLPARVDARK